MSHSLAGIALGAGAGTRMRPLSTERPKVLCPVGGTALVDHALERLGSVTTSVAVNVHETQPSLVEHLSGRDITTSVETGPALGTAGGIARLRSFVDGRPVVVVNGDTWCPGGLEALVEGWDGRRIRVLVPGGGPFGPSSAVAGALMPWADVRDLDEVPTGLWEVSWRRALADGRLEAVPHHGPFHDCADPVDYLEANLAATGGQSAVSASATVLGRVHQCVVWPGAVVAEHEQLRRAIRTTAGRTVLVRRPLAGDAVTAASAR